jgi:uncharacterized membrane-anchored protein
MHNETQQLEAPAPVAPARERWWLLAAVGLQLLVLVGLVAWRIGPLLNGEAITVRVEPVDPRDLFRGDYVILSYAFSRANNIDGMLAPAEGQTVYVVLMRDGTHWRADHFTYRKPTEGVFLRGKALSGGRIEYGIESYFVQEGTGRKYEDAVRDRTLIAELRVTRDGTAALHALKIE